MSRKKKEPPAEAVTKEPEGKWVTRGWFGARAFTAAGMPVELRCFDGGDVELVVNAEPVTFEDGIILRWGRKRT